MAEQHLITAEFFGAPVSIVDHAGKRWLTAEETGRCLGYAKANASQGVRNLYNRHADEFTDADTCQINLIWQGQQREIRIFSGTGCRLLGFFANTPQAKKFRAWAAQTLEAVAPIAEAAPAAYVLPPRPEAKLRITRQTERIIFEMFVSGMNIQQIGDYLHISRTAASLVLHGKYQWGPSTGTPECSQALIEAVAARHLAVELERLAVQQDRIANRYLSSAHNLALAAALDGVGRRLQRQPAQALAAPKGGAA